MPAQPEDTRERLRKGDRTLLRPFGHPVSINEVHAVLISTCGVLFGHAYATGLELLVLPLVLLLIGYSILGRPMFSSLCHDDPNYDKSIGLKTIKHEPWYFIPPFILWFVLGTTVATFF